MTREQMLVEALKDGKFVYFHGLGFRGEMINNNQYQISFEMKPIVTINIATKKIAWNATTEYISEQYAEARKWIMQMLSQFGIDGDINNEWEDLCKGCNYGPHCAGCTI